MAFLGLPITSGMRRVSKYYYKMKCTDIVPFSVKRKQHSGVGKIKAKIKMKFMMVSVLLIFAMAVPNIKALDTFENYVRRNVPSGFTMEAFVETCEGCGVLYGKDFTYKCLADKTLSTFKGCFIAVHSRK